jgi:hypothetical protein
MSGIPSSDDLTRSIEDFTAAYQRWQRAATAHDVLLRIQGGELPPPLLEFVVKGKNGEPVRVSIDLSHLPAGDTANILNPMVDFLYGEYKQSLFDAGLAASASHKLLETQERFHGVDGSSPSGGMPGPRDRLSTEL